MDAEIAGRDLLLSMLEEDAEGDSEERVENEVADRIARDGGITWDDMEEMLGLGRREIRFMAVRMRAREILREDGVELLPTGDGYRVATESEKVRRVLPGQLAKHRRALARLLFIQQRIDQDKLQADERKMADAASNRAGYLLAMSRRGQG